MSTGLGNGRLRPVKLRDGRVVYIGDWTDAFGDRHRKSLGQDKEAALRRLAQLITERNAHEPGQVRKPAPDPLLEDLSKRFLEYIKPRRKPSHVAQVCNRLPRVLRALAVQRVRELTPGLVQKYRDHRETEKAAPATVNQELFALRAMLRWAVDREEITTNPIDGVRASKVGPAEQKRPRRALSEEEVERLLEASAAIDAKRAALGERIPQTALWSTLVNCAPRWGELTSTTWTDFDEDARTLRLRAENTKSKKERTLPLTDAVVALIVALRVRHYAVLGRLREASAPIFLTPRGTPWSGGTSNALRRLHEILKLAKIDRVQRDGSREYSVDIHSLRHSAATSLARNGMPIHTLQAIMGHSSPTLTTRYYIHESAADHSDAMDAAQRTRAEKALVRRHVGKPARRPTKRANDASA